MDDKNLSFYHALERQMAGVFEWAAKDYDLLSFARAFLPSETFGDFFQDMTLFSQSPLYILDVFGDEPHGQILPSKYQEKDIAYWMGYLFAAWHLEEGISGKEIASRYDLQYIWYGYDTLHTQDIRYAIDFVKEEYAFAQAEPERDGP